MISGIGSSHSSYFSSYTANKNSTTVPASTTSDDENPLKNLFKALDADGDGSISQSELTAAASSSGESDDSTAIDVDQLLSLMDQDSSDSISQREFASAFAPPPPPLPVADADSDDLADELIVSLDADASGTLSTLELAALDDTNSTSLMSALDEDENGEVSQDELSRALQASMMAHTDNDDSSTSGTVSAASTSSTAANDAVNLLAQTVIRKYQSVSNYSLDASKASRISVSV